MKCVTFLRFMGGTMRTISQEVLEYDRIPEVPPKIRICTAAHVHFYRKASSTTQMHVWRQSFEEKDVISNKYDSVL